MLVQGDRGSSAGFAGATIPGGRCRKGGEAPRRGETGFVMNYALGILVGAVAVIAFFLTR